jgi:hypothetical protein
LAILVMLQRPPLELLLVKLQLNNRSLRDDFRRSKTP